MKLSEIKQYLKQVSQVTFQLPDGSLVPTHFHVTEVGKINKHFIDCGGKMRQEVKVNFQLWSSVDTDHRLSAQKLIDIIELSQEKLELPDVELEVEYQAGTIGKFGLEFKDGMFLLTNTYTDCLAKDNCGIPKPKVQLSNLKPVTACSPNSGCC